MASRVFTQGLIESLYPQGNSKEEKNFYQAWKRRQSFQIIVASTFLGLAYPVFGDGFESIVPYINGLAIGVLGGIAISLIELFLFPSFKKDLSFIGFVVLKSLTYTLVITAFVFSVILVSRSFQFDLSIVETFHHPLFRHFLFEEDFFIIIVYALIFATAVIFTREISGKMGQGILINLITGRYRVPRKESRIFMFIDLDSSVSIAESLGDLRYHNMLNDFFYDITDCILTEKGIIYQYVGDQMVVSWRTGNGADASLRAYINCMQKISSLAERYTAKYGCVPEFKAALHAGEVISGEIGSVKTEIVYHGDVVNTTSRLERMCSELQEGLLISEVIFNMLSDKVQKAFEKIGSLKLKGRRELLEIYGVRKNAERLPDLLEINPAKAEGIK